MASLQFNSNCTICNRSFTKIITETSIFPNFCSPECSQEYEVYIKAYDTNVPIKLYQQVYQLYTITDLSIDSCENGTVMFNVEENRRVIINTGFTQGNLNQIEGMNVDEYIKTNIKLKSELFERMEQINNDLSKPRLAQPNVFIGTPKEVERLQAVFTKYENLAESIKKTEQEGDGIYQVFVKEDNQVLDVRALPDIFADLRDNRTTELAESIDYEILAELENNEKSYQKIIDGYKNQVNLWIDRIKSLENKVAYLEETLKGTELQFLNARATVKEKLVEIKQLKESFTESTNKTLNIIDGLTQEITDLKKLRENNPVILQCDEDGTIVYLSEKDKGLLRNGWPYVLSVQFSGTIQIDGRLQTAETKVQNREEILKSVRENLLNILNPIENKEESSKEEIINYDSNPSKYKYNLSDIMTKIAPRTWAFDISKLKKEQVAFTEDYVYTVPFPNGFTYRVKIRGDFREGRIIFKDGAFSYFEGEGVTIKPVESTSDNKNERKFNF
jgi:hypothetical protein